MVLVTSARTIMVMKVILTYLSLLLFSCSLIAQDSINLDTLNQFKVVIDKTKTASGILNNNAKGLTFFQSFYKANSVSSSLSVQHLDTNLKVNKTDTIHFSKGYKELKTSGGYWGNLFMAKIRKDKWQTIIFSADLNQKDEFILSIPNQSTILDCIFFEQKLYLTINRKNNWFMLVFDNKGNQIEKMEFNNFNTINQPLLVYDIELDALNLFYYDLSKSMAQLHVKIILPDSLTHDYNLNNGLTGYLRPGIIEKIGEEEFLFIGNVNIPGESISSGFYFLKLDEGYTSVGNIYKYNDLTNFLQFLSENKREDYDRQKMKKMANGKPFNYADYVNLTHYFKTNDEFIIVGEVFEPIYHTERSYGYRMGPYPQYYTVFDGYNYQQIFAVGIDSDGLITWDAAQSFEYFKLPKKLYSIHSFEESKNGFLGFYNNEEAIIENNLVAENDTYDFNSGARLLTGSIANEKFIEQSSWFDNATYMVYQVNDKSLPKDQRNSMVIVKIKL